MYIKLPVVQIVNICVKGAKRQFKVYILFFFLFGGFQMPHDKLNLNISCRVKRVKRRIHSLKSCHFF